MIMHKLRSVVVTTNVSNYEIYNNLFSTGFGGQVDFIRGAAEGFDGKGKPIIALPSVTKKNESKIVPFIKQGENDNGKSFFIHGIHLNQLHSCGQLLTTAYDLINCYQIFIC